ncbi:MAG: DUF2802 domain-containing protein [bacterium]|nr:DUF2802 domain-containing protein [bacterium]
MQLFILIIINVFMGALLYLVISLKLEKSASEFREKKLRKEMDDIIKEFNVTADRNISLLENRITIMKRLLERSGDIQKLDVRVGEDDFSGTGESIKESPAVKQENASSSVPGSVPLNTDTKKGLLYFLEKGINSFSQIVNEIKEKIASRELRHAGDTGTPGVSRAEKGSADRVPGNGKDGKERKRIDILVEDGFENDLIRKDLAAEYSEEVSQKDVSQKDVLEKEVSQKEVSKEEMERMFAAAADKYSLIAELYRQGQSIDALSRYSGIPAGEVRLVLNLNNS